ncbi:hypothetical protein ACFLWU_01675 [Chloroflexota bacterium]
MQAETDAKGEPNALYNIARVISKITNPYSLCALLFLLVACAKASSLSLLLSWVAVILIFLVVWPPLYVYIRTSTGSGENRSKNPITFFRHRLKDVIIISVTAVVPCVTLLVILQASPFLIFSFVVMLAISLGVVVTRRFYKASHHLAIATGASLVLVITWEYLLIPLLAFIIVIGWARYTLGQHSIMQLAAGTSLAIVIGVLITYSWFYV